MKKIKNFFSYFKDKFISFVVLGLAIFCLINVFINLNVLFIVFFNSLGFILSIIYLVNFEGEMMSKLLNKMKKNKYFLYIYKFIYFHRWQLVMVVFLCALLLLGIMQLFGFELFKNEFFNKMRSILILLSVITGVLLYWKQNKNHKKQSNLENEKIKQNNFQVLAENFLRKHKFFNFLPGFKKVLGLIYKNGWVYSLGILGIILGAVFLRLYNLDNLGLTFDEGTSWLATKMILEKGWPEMPTGFNYLRGLPYFYLNALIVFFFGFSEYAMRLLSVISSLLLIIYVYKLLKKLNVSSDLVLLGVAFFSFHYWIVMLSRWNRMYMLAVLFVIMALYYFILYIQEKKIKQLLLFVIIATLAIFTHNTGYVVLLYLPLYFLVDFRKNLLISFKELIFFISSFLFLIFIKFIISYLGSNPSVGETVNYYPHGLLGIVVNSFHVVASINLNIILVLLNYFSYFFPILIIGIFAIKNTKLISRKFLYVLGFVIVVLTHFYNDQYFVGGRILFFEFVFLIIISLVLISDFNKFIRQLLILVFLIILMINSGFIVPFIDYGDTIQYQYSSSHVLSFYPDNKGFALELNQVIEDNDVVLFYGNPINSYPYLVNVNPSQIYQITKNNADQDLDQYWGYNRITTKEEIDNVIKNSVGNVYVISTFSILSYSDAAPYLYHFRPYLFDQVLEENNYDVIYKSNDGVSSLIKLMKEDEFPD